MKKNKFFLAGLPVIALALGMMVAGCASYSTRGGGTKTIIITGFDMPAGAVVEMLLLKSWDPWTISASNGGAERDGQTLRAVLWKEGVDNVRWDGTGKYDLLLTIKVGGKEEKWQHLGTIDIKDAETKLDWSSFSKGWG